MNIFSKISKLIYEQKYDEASLIFDQYINNKINEGIEDYNNNDDPISGITDGGTEDPIQSQRTFTNLPNAEKGSNMTHGGNASKKNNPLNVGHGLNNRSDDSINSSNDLLKMFPDKEISRNDDYGTRNIDALKDLNPHITSDQMKNFLNKTGLIDKEIRSSDYDYHIAVFSKDKMAAAEYKDKRDNLINQKKKFIIDMFPEFSDKEGIINRLSSAYKAEKYQISRIKTRFDKSNTQRVKG